MRAFATALLLVSLAAPASAGDREDLTNLLNDFLAGAAGSAEAHSRFWADDLIYTSSSGKRFGKDEIMQGMAEAKGEPVTASYRGEEVDVRLFGDTAVVAFKLIGKDKAGDEVKVTHYLNTGTFLKRDGEWRAVAWQATRIPNGEK